MPTTPPVNRYKKQTRLKSDLTLAVASILILATCSLIYVNESHPNEKKAILSLNYIIYVLNIITTGLLFCLGIESRIKYNNIENKVDRLKNAINDIQNNPNNVTRFFLPNTTGRAAAPPFVAGPINDEEAFHFIK